MELEHDFRILIRASKPIFSGSVDHRVNILDIVKVKKYLSLSESLRDLPGDDVHLMKKLVELD